MPTKSLLQTEFNNSEKISKEQNDFLQENDIEFTSLVKKSNIKNAGFGLFANREFNEGDLVAYYTVTPINSKKRKKLQHNQYKINFNILQNYLLNNIKMKTTNKKKKKKDNNGKETKKKKKGNKIKEEKNTNEIKIENYNNLQDFVGIPSKFPTNFKRDAKDSIVFDGLDHGDYFVPNFGRFINSSSKTDKKKNVELGVLRQSYVKVEQMDEILKNISQTKIVYCFKATKKIEKGEEILWTYQI